MSGDDGDDTRKDKNRSKTPNQVYREVGYPLLSLSESNFMILLCVAMLCICAKLSCLISKCLSGVGVM